jgi:FkbM family methyltransferase
MKTNHKNMIYAASTMRNWLDSLSWQVEFTEQLRGRKRTDGERDWTWYEHATAYRKRAIKRLVRQFLPGLHRTAQPQMTIDWLRDNAGRLWETRSMLADDLSRLLFDASLVLRISSHRQFYFPRIDFEDLAEVKKIDAFAMDGLPRDYLGLPLRVCELTLRMPDAKAVDLRVICTEQLVDGLNSYRQYLTTRNGMNVSPRNGEVVLDCGACIGDFSLLFAAMVGESGQVHAFDPIPLHNRYCALQAQLNPKLAPSLHFNVLAVGARSSRAAHPVVDCDHIDPGHRVDEESFDCTSLDDYVGQGPQRVDFIKMDIEGAEMDAIEGAAGAIKQFKPRLAISGYHKPADLWEIPQKLKALNPNYELTFGHHSPVQWESVFYAVHRP